MQPKAFQKKNYSQLKPKFNEAINWISDHEEADIFFRMLAEFVPEMKGKNVTTTRSTGNETYVSSNVPIETANKHHRCSSWKQSKKQSKK